MYDALMRASPSRPVSHADARAFVEVTVREVGDMIARTPVSSVRSKGVLDLVSGLDERAERLLIERLTERFPNEAILAEESAPHAQYAERLWVVDPLDGTLNRVAGFQHYAVSVALLVHGEPVVGCVYDPVHGELFSAERGGGAWLNGAALQARTTPVRCVALSSGALQQLAERSPATLAAVARDWGKFRNLGSQSLHLCYVAAGRLAAAASAEAKLWDDAAGALLVSETGGTYTRFDGRTPFPLRGDEGWLRGEAMPSIALGAAHTNDRLALLGGLTR
jgi:myo-inositol-1(or 4)-monophosphatase